jgi:hypothetical protein
VLLGKARRTLLLAALAAAVLSAPAAHAAPPTTVTITAQPALYPGFDRAITDYVTRCTGNPVQVTVRRPSGSSVVVDGQITPHSGTTIVPVNIGSGQAFPIVITFGGQTTTHYVRCLPTDFFGWSATRTGPTQAEWYIVTPTTPSASTPYVAILDNNGVPVWWFRGSGQVPIDAKLLSNGNLAWTPKGGGGFGLTPGVAYQERRLDGTLVRSLATVGVPTDFHDLQRLPNGNYLLLAYRPRDGVDLTSIGGPANATVLDGEVQELTPAGSLVWSWNSKDHTTVSETGRWSSDAPVTLPDGRKAYDLVHINAVEPDGAGLLVSLRHNDAVLRISRATGDVLWKLGGTNRPERLTVVGDPRGEPTLFGGQHDVRVYSDGSVSVYDNGTALHRRPRVVRYQIDPVAKTATFVEQLVDPEAPGSICCGSARKLTGGNWVTSWTNNPLVTETTPSGSRVFRLAFEGGQFTYRAVPVQFGALSRNALRDGMTAMNPR